MRELPQLLEGDEKAVGHLEIAELGGDGDIGDHAAPEEGDLARARGGQVEHLLDPVDV